MKCRDTDIYRLQYVVFDQKLVKMQRNSQNSGKLKTFNRSCLWAPMLMLVTKPSK